MTAEMAYGALSAKVRALYGKRLRSDDFARLAARRSEAEILDELRQHPGWSRALALVPPGAWGYVGRVEVERALQEELRLEYQSLAYYVPREDKPLMQFQLRAAERSAILSALRRLKAGLSPREAPPPPRGRGRLHHLRPADGGRQGHHLLFRPAAAAAAPDGRAARLHPGRRGSADGLLRPSAAHRPLPVPGPHPEGAAAGHRGAD